MSPSIVKKRCVGCSELFEVEMFPGLISVACPFCGGKVRIP